VIEATVIAQASPATYAFTVPDPVRILTGRAMWSKYLTRTFGRDASLDVSQTVPLMAPMPTDDILFVNQ
jgi:hypothetical protein